MDVLQNIFSCQFDVIWYTDRACVSRTTSNCITTDKDGNVYDLKQLIRTKNNYKIPHSTEKYDEYFILNVCHSVINEERVICKSNDGICLFSFDAQNFDNR